MIVRLISVILLLFTCVSGFTLRSACTTRWKLQLSSTVEKIQLEPSTTKTSLSSSSKPITGQAVVKVPATAWRWPPSWPFMADSFELVPTESKKEYSLSSMTTMKEFFVSNRADMGKSVLVVGNAGESTADIAQYGWTSVLSLGEELQQFKTSSFDSVVVMSGIDHQKDPLVQFKELWRVLKPSGCLYACFTGGKQGESLNQVKLWTTTTDEQKMWVVGSYCYYASPQGWDSIEGYDITGASGDQAMVFTTGDNDKALPFMVRAQKAAWQDLDLALETEALALRIQPRLAAISSFAPLESKLMALRFAAEMKSHGALREQDIEKKLPKLQEIYEVLKDVKDTVIPKAAKITLAYLLIDEWNNSESQRKALRMSVGLEAPDDFWRSVGQATMKLKPSEKIFFLADLITCFGKDALLEMSMNMVLPDLLNRVLAALKERLPDLDEAKVQEIAVELVVSEGIKPNFAHNERILSYISTASLNALKEICARESRL